MRLSSRSKLSILLSAVTFVAVIGAIVLTAVPRGPTIHAAGGSGPTAIKGTATRVGSFSLSTLTSSQSTQAAPANLYQFDTPARLASSSLIPSGIGSSAPSGQGVTLSNPPAGVLLQNFNGVSSLDTAAANIVGNSSFVVEPPDQGLCVGQGIVVEPVNDAYRIFSTDGKPQTILAIPLYKLFQEPPLVFTSTGVATGVDISDPRCVFDAATGDFFFTAVAFPLPLTGSPTSSRIDVTVFNPSSNTMTPFRIDTTDLGGPGCPCVADQPKLGIDQFNIYISADEFTFANLSFNGSNVYVLSKSQLAALNVEDPNMPMFLHLRDAGIPVPALQPAISTGNPPVEYLVHSFVLTTPSDRLGVFAIANGQVVSSGGMPTLLGPVVAQSEGYSQPQAAPSTGGVSLDAGDDRLQQVQYINGRLWAALDTGISIPGSLVPPCNQGVCDAAAWFQIAPVLIQNHLIGAVVTQQGYVAANGASVLYPAIVQSRDGTVDMAFSVTSPTLNPSAAFALNVNQNFLSQGHVFIAATGADPDKGFTCFPPFSQHICRWGDYSWATLDPSSNNIWMGSEYILPSPIVGFPTNWGTRIYEVAA